MTKSSIGVGIVGASMERGWAKTAHVPALSVLDDYEIRGVSARRPETAERSARELGVDIGVTDHRALVEHPRIDLVVVTVKVPDHLTVVRDALGAGKMVYCEWPLGRSVAEAEEMAGLAEEAGVDTIIGLQGSMSPTLRHVRDLLRDGVIGRPLSTSLRAQVPGGQWTGALRSWQDFTKDTANGATLLTIPLGHALEPFTRALGEVVEVSGLSVRQRSNAVTVEGEPAVTDAPDEVLAIATLDTGVVASIHYSGGEATVGRDVVWQIIGEEGRLVVGVDSGYLHIDEVTVTLGREGRDPVVLATPAELGGDLPTLRGPAANVGRLYRHFARRRAGLEAEHVPDFADALRRHRVLAAVETATATGRRQTLGSAAVRTG